MAEFKKISELDRAETLLDTDLFIVETLTGTKTITRALLKEEAETITPEDIGLGNVNNTSDLDKPISNATQLALDLKVNVSDMEQYLTQEDASTIYETKNNASGTYLSKVDAVTYYITKDGFKTEEYTDLTTTSKNIIGAINEINVALNNINDNYVTKDEFNTALIDIETLLQGV